MPDSAIPFDFPPPVKSQKIRLVLPDDDFCLDEQPCIPNRSEVRDDSVSDFSNCASTNSINFTSRESELNELELALIEREEAVKQAEIRLIERERSLWEFEALILAREKLLSIQEEQSQKQKTTTTELSGEEMEALQKLRTEVERQQQKLEQTNQELKEREKFVEASEERLLEKTMEQQEEESRLEQLKEDLDARELRINQLEGKPPPPQVEKEVL